MMCWICYKEEPKLKKRILMSKLQGKDRVRVTVSVCRACHLWIKDRRDVIKLKRICSGE